MASRFCIPLQEHQFGTHLGGVLVTQIAVFLQRAIDDAFQFER